MSGSGRHDGVCSTEREVDQQTECAVTREIAESSRGIVGDETRTQTLLRKGHANIQLPPIIKWLSLPTCSTVQTSLLVGPSAVVSLYVVILFSSAPRFVHKWIDLMQFAHTPRSTWCGPKPMILINVVAVQLLYRGFAASRALRESMRCQRAQHRSGEMRSVCCCITGIGQGETFALKVLNIILSFMGGTESPLSLSLDWGTG